MDGVSQALLTSHQILHSISIAGDAIMLIKVPVFFFKVIICLFKKAGVFWFVNGASANLTPVS
jgi:hypothetical protein